MKRKDKISVLAITLLASIILIVFLQTPLHSQTIPTMFIAGTNSGFDLGPGNLNFGKIVPGSHTTRNITITNTYNHPTTTSIKASGAISPYIIVSENDFVLGSGESKELIFSAFPTAGIELKEYPGEITLTTSKA